MWDLLQAYKTRYPLDMFDHCLTKQKAGCPITGVETVENEFFQWVAKNRIGKWAVIL